MGWLSGFYTEVEALLFFVQVFASTSRKTLSGCTAFCFQGVHGKNCV